jgi:hypothetical protein
MGTDTGALDFEHHSPVDVAWAKVEAQAHVCQRYLGSAFLCFVEAFDVIGHSRTSSNIWNAPFISKSGLPD